jgi:hypothetical protein
MNDDTDDQRQQAWLEHQLRQHEQDIQQGMQQECVPDDFVGDGVNGDGDDAQFDVFTGAPLTSAAWLVLLSDCSETNSFRSMFDSAWASLLLQDQGMFVARDAIQCSGMVLLGMLLCSISFTSFTSFT